VNEKDLRGALYHCYHSNFVAENTAVVDVIHTYPLHQW
jgi:hypothetical protein